MQIHSLPLDISQLTRAKKGTAAPFGALESRTIPVRVLGVSRRVVLILNESISKDLVADLAWDYAEELRLVLETACL